MQGPGGCPEEVIVINEYEVRQMVEAIELSDERPLTKARKLMKLNHSLSQQLEKLQTGATMIDNDDGHDGAQRLRQTENRLRFLAETVRLKAHKLLVKPKPLRFETYPTQVYPN